MLTIEEILQGGAATQAVDQLKSITTACAILPLSPLVASSVSGQAAAVTFTTTLSAPGHPPDSVPAPVGGAQNGNRVVLLVTANAKAPSPATGTATASAPPPDLAAFAALLKQAYTAEKRALG